MIKLERSLGYYEGGYLISRNDKWLDIGHQTITLQETLVLHAHWSDVACKSMFLTIFTFLLSLMMMKTTTSNMKSVQGECANFGILNRQPCSQPRYLIPSSDGGQVVLVDLLGETSTLRASVGFNRLSSRSPPSSSSLLASKKDPYCTTSVLTEGTSCY